MYIYSRFTLALLLAALLVLLVEPVASRDAPALREGFEWVYDVTTIVEEGISGKSAVSSVRQVIRVVNVTGSGDSLRYTIKIEALTDERAPDVYMILDDKLFIRETRIYNNDVQVLLKQHDPGAPFVWIPEGVGDRLELEYKEIIYNSSGEVVASLAYVYKLEAVEVVEMEVWGRVLPFYKVVGSYEVVDVASTRGTVPLPASSAVVREEYYVNKDLMLPVKWVTESIVGDRKSQSEMVLIGYKMEPDPLVKYPVKERVEKQSYTLTIRFNIEGNYTDSEPDAVVEVLGEDGRVVHSIPVKAGGEVKVEVEPGSYVLVLNPAQGQTKDGAGVYEFSGWRYKGEYRREPRLAVQVNSGTIVELNLAVYKPHAGSQETVTATRKVIGSIQSAIGNTNNTTATPAGGGGEGKGFPLPILLAVASIAVIAGTVYAVKSRPKKRIPGSSMHAPWDNRKDKDNPTPPRSVVKYPPPPPRSHPLEELARRMLAALGRRRRKCGDCNGEPRDEDCGCSREDKS